MQRRRDTGERWPFFVFICLVGGTRRTNNVGKPRYKARPRSCYKRVRKGKYAEYACTIALVVPLVVSANVLEDPSEIFTAPEIPDGRPFL